MSVDLGGRLVGEGCTPYVIAELGPSWCVGPDHAVNLDTLRRLIVAAKESGADAVKLQLKSFEPGGYYEHEDLTRPLYDAPFATRGDYVRAREPDYEVLNEVSRVCREEHTHWSASPWDLPSVGLLAGFDVPWVKVASASLTDLRLLGAVKDMGLPIILSTGMSTLSEIETAIEVLGPTCCGSLILMHCVSVYPAHYADLNLRCIETLRKRFDLPVGYSGHEVGVQTSVAAATQYGACVIERHLTLDRAQWGPDHASSLEPDGLRRLVRDIRAIEAAAGDGLKRMHRAEEAARKRLRRAG